MSSSSPNRVQKWATPSTAESTNTSGRSTTSAGYTSREHSVLTGKLLPNTSDLPQDHSDSGIENCNSSDVSNFHTTTVHEEDDDATSATTSTIDQGMQADCVFSSSGSENDICALNSIRRNSIAYGLTDYEIVESTEDATTSRTHPSTATSISACATTTFSPSEMVVETKPRLDNCNKIATSKEEKQRQNEEIIILESSSVSSETDSWESVAVEKLQQLAPSDVAAALTTPDTGTSSSAAHTSKSSSHDSKPIRTACFIDASTLFDDSELEALNVHQSQDTIVVEALENCDSNQEANENGGREMDNSKIRDTKTVVYEIKDQFSSGEFTPLLLSGGGVLSSTSSCAGESLRGQHYSTSPKNPEESERLQGSLLFRNSINQYSGVLIEDQKCTTDSRDQSQERAEDYETKVPLRGYPLRNTRSDFNCLSETNQENKRNNITKISCLQTQSWDNAEQQGMILPDTPHNSLLNVNIIQDNEKGESMDGWNIPKRQLKYMESAPIVSGGVSVADFSPKMCDSPPVRRKLDTCPILSGGFEAKRDNEEMVKVIRPEHASSSSLKTWVIDLNNLPQNEEAPPAKNQEKPNIISSECVSVNNFSGFFVSLDDVPPESQSGENDNEAEKTTIVQTQEKPSTNNLKKSTGFFIDMSMDKDDVNPIVSESNSRASVERKGCEEGKESENDKKNMFSIFIDLGEKRPVPPKDSLKFTSKLSQTVNRIKEKERRSKSPTVMSAGAEKSSSLSFVAVEKQNVQIRPKFKQSLSEDITGTMKIGVQEAEAPPRPTSLTAEDPGLMSILDKIPLLSKTSNLSIDSSISQVEDIACSKSELSTFSNSTTSNSNISNTKELNILGNAEKRHRKDAKINETFDKSTRSSITDEALIKDLSPDSTGTNTDDVTYQNELVSQEDLGPAQCGPGLVECKYIDTTNNFETILESNNNKIRSPSKKLLKGGGHRLDACNPDVTHTMESLQATIEKQRKLLLETVNETAETTSFVRLSDMDKPYQSFEIYSSAPGQQSLTRSDRRSRFTASNDLLNSTGPGTYYEKARHNNMYYSTDTNIINLASSFENSRSLSRIFPHLSKVFSSSLPANVGMENSQTSELTSMSSDLSVISSVTSSCNRLGQDSGDESSIFCRQPRRLGEDLLKMFLHEIGTDVTIDIGHRKMKAHKCILQSRCQYFAAILAGGWVHNAGNVISLPGYSYEAVHFALCHIYSGASHPPEGISLMELAAIADLLGLVGLREVTAYALKVNYCHNFHKPCLGCIEGILQVLPVALNHGLDGLYRKCLKWTCKYYLKIWPTRMFASLTSDLRLRCQQQIIAHLCSENVLNTILDCENLLAVVAPLHWGAAVETILHEISDTAQIYLSEHFASLIASDSFLSLGHDQSCNIPALENLLLRTASTLSPDQACRSYQRVTKLHQVLHSKILTQQQDKMKTIVGVELDEGLDWDVDFIRLVTSILSFVEQCLQRQCSRAMRTSAWQRLDLELRKKIQKLACLTDPLFERRQKANARQKQPVYQVNYNRNQDIQQVRLAIHAHSKRSAQGYIIDQFPNNHNGGGGGVGKHGHNKLQSTYTQTHLNNNGGPGGNYNRERRDKSVQANNDISKNIGRNKRQNEAVKLEKSKSHSHVDSTTMPKTNTRNVPAPITGNHNRMIQRNLSMSHVNNEVIGKFRTDVKSRYMDLSKKPQRISLPENESVRHLKRREQQYSSSGSSTRTMSPLTNRAIHPKNGDTQMSLDSLASPKKQSLNQPRDVLAIHHDENSLSRDSLGDSIRSSMRTEGTVSQESLENKARNRLNVGSKIDTKYVKNSQRSVIAKGSTCGSAVSVGVTQKPGGRLQRNFSDSGVVSRNPSKVLSSNSNSSNASTRTSFLSKKSKEILKRRSQNNQQIDKTIDSTKVEETLRGLPINKSSSTSNIPSKPRIFNTTLHLRKTAQWQIPEKPTTAARTINTIPAKIDPKLNSQSRLKPSRIAQKIRPLAKNVQEAKETQAIKKVEKFERDILMTEKALDVLELNDREDTMDACYESGMVRSSTFSKDCPDLSLSIHIS